MNTEIPLFETVKCTRTARQIASDIPPPTKMRGGTPAVIIIAKI